jgi:hypothetical protein
MADAPTETQIEHLITAVDAEIVDALDARDVARKRLLLQIGLSATKHPEAARFDGSDEEYARAEQRVTDLELKRQALHVAACYTAWHSNQAKLDVVRRRSEALSQKIAEFSDVTDELRRRELNRLRASGANLSLGTLDSIPVSPSAEYLASFSERHTAYKQLMAELQALNNEGAGVSAALNSLEKKYGPAVVHALAGS